MCYVKSSSTLNTNNTHNDTAVTDHDQLALFKSQLGSTAEACSFDDLLVGFDSEPDTQADLNTWSLNDFLASASADTMLTNEFSMFDTTESDVNFMDSWYGAMGLVEAASSSPTDTLAEQSATSSSNSSVSPSPVSSTMSSDAFLIPANVDAEAAASFTMPLVAPATMAMEISATGGSTFFPDMMMPTPSFIKSEPTFSFSGSEVPSVPIGIYGTETTRIPTVSVNPSPPQEQSQRLQHTAKTAKRSTRSKPTVTTTNTSAPTTSAPTSTTSSTSPTRKRSRPSTASRSLSPSHSDDEAEGGHDEDDDIVRKRQRNTEAARRSRARKVMKMTSLEQRVKELQGENSRLSLRLAVLESERVGWVAKENELAGKVKQLESQLAEAHGAIMKLGGRGPTGLM